MAREERRKRRRKKRKEEKDEEKRQKTGGQPMSFMDPLAAGPGPIGSQQRMGIAGGGMNHSQSEPAVSSSASKGPGGGILGGLPMPPASSAAEEQRPAVRGSLGLSPSVPQPFSFGAYDSQPEGLSNVGRVRVKAGIRLQPLSPNAGASGANDMNSSASVPLLHNRQELNPL